MVNSRLFELLADSYARPPRWAQDLHATTGAATTILDAYRKGQELKVGNAKLSDYFGADSELAKRYPNLRVKDLDRKGVAEGIKLEMENGPVDVFSPTFDEKGTPTGMVKLGKERKNSKMVTPPYVNIMAGRKLSLDEMKNENDTIMKEISTLESQRDGAVKQLSDITKGGIIIGRNKAQADVLKNNIGLWNQQITEKSSRLHKMPDAGSTPTAPTYTAPTDLPPVQMRKTPENLFRDRSLDSSVGVSTPSVVGSSAPVSGPAAGPPQKAPALGQATNADISNLPWEAIPAELKYESSKGHFFYDPVGKHWMNHDSGQVVE